MVSEPLDIPDFDDSLNGEADRLERALRGCDRLRKMFETHAPPYVLLSNIRFLLSCVMQTMLKP
jgi:hypothetical protein